MLQRTFLTMIPHELGHAIAAWWSGFAALPTLWRTMIPDEPSVLLMVVIAAGELGLAWLGWRTERRWLVVVAGVMGVAQFLALTAEPATTHVAITFAGDAGAMVLGTLLMLAFFAPEGSKLRAGALRWGLLAIGAAAYVDVAMTWWRARGDHAAIPFGQIEGVGDSDASKLLTAGWSPSTIVDHYLVGAALCLAALLAVWAHQTWRVRSRAGAARGR
jgi:hypothetical protein